MKAEDTVMNNVTPAALLQNQAELNGLLREQAEISFKAGIKTEQKRMTKALRELHKQVWTLSEVIEAEDTMGEVDTTTSDVV